MELILSQEQLATDVAKPPGQRIAEVRDVDEALPLTAEDNAVVFDMHAGQEVQLLFAEE